MLLFQHQRFVAEAQEKEPDVILIGDSMFSNLNMTEVRLNLFLSITFLHHTLSHS